LGRPRPGGLSAGGVDLAALSSLAGENLQRVNERQVEGHEDGEGHQEQRTRRDGEEADR